MSKAAVLATELEKILSNLKNGVVSSQDLTASAQAIEKLAKEAEESKRTQASRIDELKTIIGTYMTELIGLAGNEVIKPKKKGPKIRSVAVEETYLPKNRPEKIEFKDCYQIAVQKWIDEGKLDYNIKWKQQDQRHTESLINHVHSFFPHISKENIKVKLQKHLSSKRTGKNKSRSANDGSQPDSDTDTQKSSSNEDEEDESILEETFNPPPIPAQPTVPVNKPTIPVPVDVPSQKRGRPSAKKSLPVKKRKLPVDGEIDWDKHAVHDFGKDFIQETLADPGE